MISHLNQSLYLHELLSGPCGNTKGLKALPLYLYFNSSGDRLSVLILSLIHYHYIFQGAPQLLVPYLAEAGHICPTTHNPADFVLETLLGDVEVAAQLSELSQNGKLCRKLDRMTAKGR